MRGVRGGRAGSTKLSYRDVENPGSLRRLRLDKIKEILGSGAKTIRRIFYMLNASASYNTIIKDCVWLRLQGELDWNSVHEEGRHLLGSPRYESLAEFLSSIPDEYKLSRKEAFSKHVEVWLEKATLERAFYQITDKYGLGLLVTRGQPSWTALYDASLRLDQDSLILYFGDNDSFGHQIYHTIQDFLGQLGCYPTFERIALTDEQEARFSFPKGEHHLDGVPEDDLKQMLDDSVKQYLDEQAFHRISDRESQDQEKLEALVSSEGAP